MLYEQIERDRKKEQLKAQRKSKEDMPMMQIERPASVAESTQDLMATLRNNPDIPSYPEFVLNNPVYEPEFIKQFGEVIGKKLKKKLAPVENLEQKQIQYQKMAINKGKKTMVIALDDCILKTSIFKEELPRIDGEFIFQKLRVYVCFRKYL